MKPLFLRFTLFIAICSISLSLFAQRGKKKLKDDVFASIPATEAERIFTEGEKNFILEDYTKALFYFQQVLEYSPNNATVYYKLAEIYLKGNTENDLQRATQSIESALKIEKKNKYFYLLASRIYGTQHQFEKAASSLITMMKEVNGTEEHLYELAAIYLQDNRLDDALKTLNQVEDVFGISEISSLQKQQIYLQKGKLNDAIAEGEKLMLAFPDEERYVLAQAEMLSQQNQPLKGIVYLEKFIATHPDAGNSKVLMAGLYRDAGQEQKSRELVLQLFNDADVATTSKVLMLGTYNSMLSQNKSKRVKDTELENFIVSLFKSLVEKYPNDPDVHLVGGDLFLMLEKNDDACREYLKAVRNGGGSFEAWQNLLFLENQSGKPDSVITHAEQALELFPNQAMLYYFSGLAYSKKKNFKEATRVLEQARKLSSGNPNLLGEIYSMLGDSYNAIKDYDKSDKAYDAALEVEPNNEYVLNNYSYFLSLRKVNLEKAEKMAALLAKNRPDIAAYLDTYAWVLFQEGKYKEAKRIMERLVLLSSANAVHFEHYGDILYQLGDINEAVEQWQKAKSLHGDSEVLNKKISDRRIH